MKSVAGCSRCSRTAYMNRIQIAPEERAQAAAFGAPFAEYHRRVRQ